MISLEKIKKSMVPPSHSLNLSRKANDLIAQLGPQARVLDLGSGTRRLAGHVVNMDLQFHCEVDVIADASRLPFKDNSFDCVIVQAVLQCIAKPARVVDEIKRVLKKGGYVYAEVPFLQFYMPSPEDYHRFTAEGVRSLFRDFVELDAGICVGPTSALLGIMRVYATVLFPIPFISGFFYRLAGFLFAPLRFIDVILAKRKGAEVIAAAFYVCGRKS